MLSENNVYKTRLAKKDEIFFKLYKTIECLY